MSSFQAGNHRRHPYDVRASSSSNGNSNSSSAAGSPQNADLDIFKMGKIKKKNNKKAATTTAIGGGSAAESSPAQEHASSAPPAQKHIGVASEEPADGKKKKKSSAAAGGKKRRDGKIFGGIGKKDKAAAAAGGGSKRNSRSQNGGSEANAYGVAGPADDDDFEVYGQLMDAGETDGTQGSFPVLFFFIFRGWTGGGGRGRQPMTMLNKGERRKHWKTLETLPKTLFSMVFPSCQ